MSDPQTQYQPRLQRRRRAGRIFHLVCGTTSVVGLAFLVVLIARVLLEGAAWFSWKFLNSFPSTLYPETAGVKSALWGTIWIIVITAMVAVPVGVAAAVYLEEYAENNRVTRFIHLNIANLAGVPSIVYGILGLAVFVRWMRFDRSILSGALTLSLLIMPVIIIATREALLAVPQSFRHAAYALGATRWQTVRAHVLPAAMPGIMTGIILAVSRAIGEAAPLLMIGALTYVAFVPEGLRDGFVALPLQIYDWCDRPQPVFHHLAAAGIIALLGILLPMNAIAVAIRAWHQRRKAW
ncbi:MAG: phosphate ABC transporter permease PstA [Phycisphaerae bacterium]|jgi:phosphate transport system permease protein